MQSLHGPEMGPLEDTVIGSMSTTLAGALKWYQTTGAPEFDSMWASKADVAARLAAMERLREELTTKGGGDKDDDDDDELWPGKPQPRTDTLPIFLARVRDDMRERQRVVHQRLDEARDLQAALSEPMGSMTGASARVRFQRIFFCRCIGKLTRNIVLLFKETGQGSNKP